MGEVGEPEIGFERTAVVGEIDARVDLDLAAYVVAQLLVGHVVIESRELLEVRQVDADVERELVDLVLLVVHARLAYLEELLQVLVEFLIRHVTTPIRLRLD